MNARHSARNASPHATGVVLDKAASEDRLDSWKEIAAFLNRAIRTIQRWEKIEGLPVHRLRHDKLGSIFAYRSEVSAWWNSRATKPGFSPASKPSTAPRAVTRKLIVLPFRSMSRQPEDEFLADGFTEELISELCRFHPAGLGVIARTTAMQYKDSRKRADQIGRELGVRYIIEGSIRRDGDQLRLTTQLIQAGEQTLLLSRTYDRKVSEILALQEEVAQSIAREIRLALPRPEPAHSEAPRNIPARAYDAYVNARHELNEMTAASIAASVLLFRTATKRGPKFALAFAGLANAHALLSMAPFDAVAPRYAMPAAKSAARRAIALDPALAEAHTALGLVLHHYEWAWEEAEREYLIATRLNPAYIPARLHRAWLLMALGRHHDAIEESDRAAAVARETDPRLSGVVTGTRAAAFYFLRQYDRAIADSLAAIQADPRSVLPYYVLGRAYARRGVQMEAVAHFEKLPTESSGNLLLSIALAHAQAVSGRAAEARIKIRRLHAVAKRRYVPATYFAMLHAALGEPDRAFQWFEKAYRERADGLILINVDPMVDGLREDPRFKRLVRRIGLAR